MFRRRKPIPLWQQLRGWLWPHIGWRRLGVYAMKRLTRLPGTPYSLAAGIACGVAISFTPFIGLHLILSVLLAYLLRAHLIAAAAGTLIGNPWTFPFIWLSTYKLGQMVLGSPAAEAAPVEHWTIGKLFDDVGALIWPMTIGGLLLGLMAGVVTYFVLVRVIAAYQEARRRRRERLARLRRRPGIKAPGAPNDASVS